MLLLMDQGTGAGSIATRQSTCCGSTVLAAPLLLSPVSTPSIVHCAHRSVRIYATSASQQGQLERGGFCTVDL